MRIALANWSNRLEGGAEQYTADVGTVLLARGHELALWHESSVPLNRERILGSTQIPMWDESSMGHAESLDKLKLWRPDLIYCQGLTNPATEAELQTIAPSVYFAHNHNGTCISGRKTTQFPVVQPCHRKFGPACLVNFLPRRCGGRSPLTMVRDYTLNMRRLEILAGYSKVITHSGFVRRNLEQNGIACQSVRFFVDSRTTALARPSSPRSAWRLLMIGRMTNIKGGDVLLRAVSRIAREIADPLIITMAGDGPCRGEWEREASKLERAHPKLKFRFPGWLTGAERDAAYQESDFLLFPSIWPEPFGMVGYEAGQFGVPAVAFAVGGIPDWLKDGVNGFLAPGDPPNANGFATAILKALRLSEEAHRSLRENAQREAAKATIETHYYDLIQVFEEVIRSAQRVTVNCNA